MFWTLYEWAILVIEELSAHLIDRFQLLIILTILEVYFNSSIDFEDNCNTHAVKLVKVYMQQVQCYLSAFTDFSGMGLTQQTIWWEQQLVQNQVPTPPCRTNQKPMLELWQHARCTNIRR